MALMICFAVGNFASALAPGYATFIAVRFVAGLPHGAYFGVASLVAASLAPADQRARAIGRMMLGLTNATLAGVPLATWIGQTLGVGSVGFGGLICVLSYIAPTLIGGLLIWNAVVLCLFSLAARHAWTATNAVLLVGTGVAIVPALQIRLMDVAADGGVAIAGGLGWASTGWVGALLAVAGLLIFAWSVKDESGTHRRVSSRNASIRLARHGAG